MHLALGLVTLGALQCLTNVASAEEPDAPSIRAESADDHPRRVFSLTMSPLHLFLPVVELTGEARVADKLGIAGIAGAGKVSDDSASGTKLTAGVWELGAQVRYYLFGDFRHGMQLGAELLYMHLSSSELAVSGAGVAVGPFAGYKIITDIGFTFDAQLGVEYVAARAETNDLARKASDHSFIPLLNLNVGWSF